MKWQHGHSEQDHNWYEDLQRFCIHTVGSFLLGTLIASAHAMHFSVQKFAGADLAGDLSVRPQYQHQRKHVEEDRQREDVKGKSHVTGPLGGAIDCSVPFVFDVVHHKVQRQHHGNEAH